MGCTWLHTPCGDYALYLLIGIISSPIFLYREKRDVSKDFDRICTVEQYVAYIDRHYCIRLLNKLNQLDSAYQTDPIDNYPFNLEKINRITKGHQRKRNNARKGQDNHAKK